MWFSGPDLQTDEYQDNQLFPDPSYRDELKCAVFINNIKAKESCYKEKYLTADEVKRSTEFLAKIAQLSEFKAEIDALKKGKGVSKTKAVTDLTTEAFIAALKRLCARRGRISTLMSDNATNFKAAAAELNRFIKLICNKNETIIIQIEGILNSHPLVPLSDNINEYEVLTPGHFIIGRPISAIPEPAILDISDNRLSR
ncbi:integrase catalytic domain-containing protein [Trichonephila clavipes]|nr:integrase catalytic domain-containing protein [Trichonephila clavipes]